MLNTLETKRIEILGLREWEGMDNELMFNEGISWMSRQLLNSIYRRYKIAEAFSQFFLTGYLKGELFGREFDKVKRAADYANEIVKEAIGQQLRHHLVEQHIPKLIKILELDSLVSIPIISPRTRVGASLNQSDTLKQVEKVVQMRHKKDDVQKKTKDVYEGHDVLQEFEALIMESKKTESKGYESLENFGLSVPDKMDIDETQIYDIDLIQKVKAALGTGKQDGLSRHDESGDEFDVESYVEALPKTFLADFKLSIKTKVVILLDHSRQHS